MDKEKKETVRVLTDLISWCRVNEKPQITIFEIMNMIDNIRLEKHKSGNDVKDSNEQQKTKTG